MTFITVDLTQLSSVCSQEELSRDTQGVLPQDNLCQITLERPPLTPQCLDMEAEHHLNLRLLQFL